MATETNPRPNFLSIPPELRLKVYEEVFKDNLIVIVGGCKSKHNSGNHYNQKHTPGPWNTEHGLLSVSKKVHEEAQEVYTLTLELRNFTAGYCNASFEKHLSNFQKRSVRDITLQGTARYADDMMISKVLFPELRSLTLANLTSITVNPLGVAIRPALGMAWSTESGTHFDDIVGGKHDTGIIALAKSCADDNSTSGENGSEKRGFNLLCGTKICIYSRSMDFRDMNIKFDYDKEEIVERHWIEPRNYAMSL